MPSKKKEKKEAQETVDKKVRPLSLNMVVPPPPPPQKVVVPQVQVSTASL
jgi:hypothetical protein